MPEKRTQTPSPSPDLIPAENNNVQPGNSLLCGTSNGGRPGITAKDWTAKIEDDLHTSSTRTVPDLLAQP
jgi:hypothetical protein